MKKSFKRVLSMALAVVMLALMIPAGALTITAEETVEKIYIGDAYPDGVTSADGPLYSTFYEAHRANITDKEDASATSLGSVGFGSADSGVKYEIYLVSDIEETRDWYINVREKMDIMSYGDTAYTVTLNITEMSESTTGGASTTAYYSAWFMLGGATTVNVKNVNFTVASTDVTTRSVFALGANTNLTLDTVNITTPVYTTANTSSTAAKWTIQLRSNVAESLTFKGECSFMKADGTNDGFWLGGFGTRTDGASKYVINFDGATINTGAQNLIHVRQWAKSGTSYTNVEVSAADVELNIINGSKLSATSGYILDNLGKYTVVTVNMSGGSTTTIDGNGKHFRARGTGAEVALNIDGVTMTSKNATSGGGQMFHAEGNGTSVETGRKIYGTVKNSTLTYESGSNYIIRATGSTAYGKIDLTFDKCTMSAVNYLACTAGTYMDIDLSFVNETNVTNCTRLTQIEGANTNSHIKVDSSSVVATNTTGANVITSGTNQVAVLEIINGSTMDVDGRLLHTGATDSDSTLILSKDSHAKLSMGAKYMLYTVASGTKLSLILDSWDITDSLASEVTFGTTEANGVMVNKSTTDFTFGLRNSSTAEGVTILADIFNVIGYTCGATTFGTYLEGVVMNASTRIFCRSGSSGTNFTTWNIDIVDSNISTSHSTGMFVNRKGVFANVYNVTVTNSTLSAPNSRIFYDYTHVYNADGTVKTSNYPSAEYNITINGEDSLLEAKSNVIYFDWDGDATATGKTSKASVTINGGTLKTTSSYVIMNRTDDDVVTVTVNDGSLSSPAGFISSQTGPFTLNVYGGTFGNTTDATTAAGLDIRGLSATTNIYGGTFDWNRTAGDSDVVMLQFMYSNVNIYGGTFVCDSGWNCDMLIRHSYPVQINEDLTVTETVEGYSNTGVTIYGGTFVTSQGAVIGTGTSNKNNGNITVYGGTFIKTGYSSGGYGIIAHKNQSATTTSSQSAADANYNIYGGVWVAPSEYISAYKYTSSTSEAYETAAAVTGVQKAYTVGPLNRQADNVTIASASITASNYDSYGIPAATWEIIKNDSYTKDVITAPAGTETFINDNSLIGNTYFQLPDDITTGSDEVTMRVIVELDKLITGNDYYTEFGFYVSAGTDAGINGTKQVGSGTVYDAVLENGADLWRPADGYAVALLDINSIPNSYITDSANEIYITTYVKTSGGTVYYGDSVAINIAADGNVPTDASAQNTVALVTSEDELPLFLYDSSVDGKLTAANQYL